VAARGYRFCDGILMHRAEDPNGEGCDCVVLPKCERKRVLELAHVRTGHVGVKRMRSLINKRFTWPGLGQDVVKYVETCDVCNKVNKAENKSVKLQERTVMSEPFSSVAFDIVGQLPKAKGGVKYLLTYVYIAT